MLAMTRFRDPDATTLEGLHAVAARWRSLPGNESVAVLHSADEPGLVALVSHWRRVGDYRRALGGVEMKLLLTPVMLHAIDEPSVYLPADEL